MVWVSLKHMSNPSSASRADENPILSYAYMNRTVAGPTGKKGRGWLEEDLNDSVL